MQFTDKQASELRTEVQSMKSSCDKLKKSGVALLASLGTARREAPKSKDAKKTLKEANDFVTECRDWDSRFGKEDKYWKKYSSQIDRKAIIQSKHRDGPHLIKDYDQIDKNRNELEKMSEQMAREWPLLLKAVGALMKAK